MQTQSGDMTNSIIRESLFKIVCDELNRIAVKTTIEC